MSFKAKLGMQKALILFMVIMAIMTTARGASHIIGYNNINATAFYQNGNEVCDASGNCGSFSTAGGWTNNSENTTTSLNVKVGEGDLWVNSGSGKVGIGTNTPTTKLDVNGTINASNVKINGTDVLTSYTDTNESVRVQAILNDFLNSSDQRYNNTAGWSNTSSIVSTSLSLNVSDLLFVNLTSGLVGIGLSNPARKFHVNSGLADVGIRLESTDSSSKLELKDPSGTVTLESVNGAFNINKNTGIKTRNPTVALDVNGTINASAIFVNGTEVCDSTGNCGYIEEVTESGTTALTFTGCTSGSCSIGLNEIGAGGSVMTNILDWLVNDSSGNAVIDASGVIGTNFVMEFGDVDGAGSLMNFTIYDDGVTPMAIFRGGPVGFDKAAPTSKIHLGQQSDISVDDGFICVDDSGATGASCAGTTDGVIYADNFTCNAGDCLAEAQIADKYIFNYGADGTSGTLFSALGLFVGNTTNPVAPEGVGQGFIQFQASDPEVNDSYIGTIAGLNDDSLAFFINGTVPDARFSASGNLWLGTSNQNDDDTIFFDNSTETYFKWDDSEDDFVLSHGLRVLNQTNISSTSTTEPPLLVESQNIGKTMKLSNVGDNYLVMSTADDKTSGIVFYNSSGGKRMTIKYNETTDVLTIEASQGTVSPMLNLVNFENITIGNYSLDATNGLGISNDEKAFYARSNPGAGLAFIADGPNSRYSFSDLTGGEIISLYVISGHDGELMLNDTNTGENTGTDLCIDANNRLCKCGYCA